MFTQNQIKNAAQDFSEAVKIALIRRKRSVTWLANRIGRRRSTVSRAIHGNVFPRVKAAIRKALDL